MHGNTAVFTSTQGGSERTQKHIDDNTTSKMDTTNTGTVKKTHDVNENIITDNPLVTDSATMLKKALDESDKFSEYLLSGTMSQQDVKAKIVADRLGQAIFLQQKGVTSNVVGADASLGGGLGLSGKLKAGMSSSDVIQMDKIKSDIYETISTHQKAVRENLWSKDKGVVSLSTDLYFKTKMYNSIDKKKESHGVNMVKDKVKSVFKSKNPLSGSVIKKNQK